MRLIIDSADTQAIRDLFENYPVDGVTTNPSILAKSGRQPYEVLKEIRSIIGDKDLHVQVISTEASVMVQEAHRITEVLGKNTFIKIPVTFEGVKAIKKLSQEGLSCTGTAVYTVQQAYMACLAGAKWIAPYVDRIDRLGTLGSGVECVQHMQDLIDNNGYGTQILGASFHRIDEITGLAEYGVSAATVSPEMIYKLLDDSDVASAVARFTSDFEGFCGAGHTMLDV